MKTTNLALSLALLSACNVAIPSPSTEPVAKIQPAPVADPVLDIPQTITPTCLARDFHCSHGVVQSEAGPLVLACTDNPKSAIVDQTVTEILDLPLDEVDHGYGNNIVRSFTTDLLIAYDSVNGDYAEINLEEGNVFGHYGTKFYVVVRSIDEGNDLLGLNDTVCQ